MKHRQQFDYGCMGWSSPLFGTSSPPLFLSPVSAYLTPSLHHLVFRKCFLLKMNAYLCNMCSDCGWISFVSKTRQSDQNFSLGNECYYCVLDILHEIACCIVIGFVNAILQDKLIDLLHLFWIYSFFLSSNHLYKDWPPHWPFPFKAGVNCHPSWWLYRGTSMWGPACNSLPPFELTNGPL